MPKCPALLRSNLMTGRSCVDTDGVLDLEDGVESIFNLTGESGGGDGEKADSGLVVLRQTRRVTSCGAVRKKDTASK